MTNQLSWHRLKMVRNSLSVPNIIDLDYDGRKFYIVSVRGTAYQMGLAYGKLLKEELAIMER